jgi:hypothetical protein
LAIKLVWQQLVVFFLGSKSGDLQMSREKRFLVWRRHHRKRKAARAKMKLHEQGKLPYEKLPKLAQKFLGRKRRILPLGE